MKTVRGVKAAPDFTSPWRGEAASPATDIYALGATYYYLLTGQPPFPANDLGTLRAAHQSSEPPDLLRTASGATPACAALVRQCLAKSPRDRFPSGEEGREEAGGGGDEDQGPQGGEGDQGVPLTGPRYAPLFRPLPADKEEEDEDDRRGVVQERPR